MSHFDKLKKLPTDFCIIATSANSEFAGIAHKEKPIFGRSHLGSRCLRDVKLTRHVKGVQFHPELEHVS